MFGTTRKTLPDDMPIKVRQAIKTAKCFGYTISQVTRTTPTSGK